MRLHMLIGSRTKHVRTGIHVCHRQTPRGQATLHHGSDLGSTVDSLEIEKFNNLSYQWWNEKGEFKALHSMNALRIPFIHSGLLSTGRMTKEMSQQLASLKGISILDVGCGGGILSLPLARIGAHVTGLDSGQEAIDVAKTHAAKEEGLSERVHFILGSLDELATSPTEKYDAVVVSEVIEHVANVNRFLDLCCSSLKPGGSIFLTTLHRTTASWLFGVLAAEYILRIVPPGTHDWNKFMTPQELKNLLEDNGCVTRIIHGMKYNFLTNTWSWTSDKSLNYALHAVKSTETEQ